VIGSQLVCYVYDKPFFIIDGTTGGSKVSMVMIQLVSDVTT